MTMKTQQSEEAKTEYANQLQKTNDMQTLHYHTAMPEVFQHLQVLFCHNCTQLRSRFLLGFIIRILYNINYLKRYSSLLLYLKALFIIVKERFEKIIIDLTSLKIINFLTMKHYYFFFNYKLFKIVLILFFLSRVLTNHMRLQLSQLNLYRFLFRNIFNFWM